MTQIKGPNGFVACVDVSNRLQVFAVSQNEDKLLATLGKYWSVPINITPTGADDYFFYLKNESTKNLFLTDIRISSTVATEITYEHVSGVAVGGTDIVPVNRLLGSAKLPTATIQEGVDITGLTSLGELVFEECAVVNTMYSLKLTGTIIIQQGQAIAFKRVEATGAIKAVVSIAESE